MDIMQIVIGGAMMDTILHVKEPEIKVSQVLSQNYTK